MKWVGQSIQIQVGKELLTGKVEKILPSGRLRVKTGPFEDWDIPPSLVQNGVAIIKVYQDRKVYSEFETKVKTIRV